METRPTRRTGLPRPSLLPVQAVPVARGVGAGAGDTGTGQGVAAAQNACQGLTGLGQQMCYMALYRV